MTNGSDEYQPFSSPMMYKLGEKSRSDDPIDGNVEEVIKSYRQRAAKGFAKYGTTTERQDIDLRGWLQHLQEELMDATVYIERLKKTIST